MDSSSISNSISSKEQAYKTIVISGGQGYEEYKLSALPMTSGGVLLGNSGVTTTTTTGAESRTNSLDQSQSAVATASVAVGVLSNSSNSTSTTSSTIFNNSNNNSYSNNNNSNSVSSICLPATNSSSVQQQPNIPYYFSSFTVVDESSNLGKDDLINYVLTWEI